MKHPLICSLFTIGLMAAAPAFALDIQLPPETAVFKPSDLPGYALAQRNCMTCHSVHYIQSQPTTSPRGYWDATVKKMKKPFGAQFPDADIPDIVDYLVKTYGAERSTAIPTATAAVKPAAVARTVGTAAATDTKALLATNACTGCHSIDKKIVGPAFKEVVAKYKGKANAESLVAHNIRAGGAGKWGPVPMPAFAQLSETEAMALAHYVLAQ
ncbi:MULTISPECIES: c-type cytochrome [Janthinobacterium]|uniref:SorB family sulfite dehydrogenase c-type cytochrome subunit n=1 Tax=Janthinobacterium TaxID=29580 RepID=UPI000A8B3A29|nr:MULTISPECIES: c-type cytochrome [Janthinobacterium]